MVSGFFQVGAVTLRSDSGGAARTSPTVRNQTTVGSTQAGMPGHTGSWQRTHAVSVSGASMPTAVPAGSARR